MFFLWSGLSLLFLILALLQSVPEYFLFALSLALPAVLSLVPGLEQNFGLQAGSALVLGTTLYVILRRVFPTWFQGYLLREDSTEDSGNIAIVVEAIRPDRPGRIRYRGTTWTAVSLTETFPRGSRVLILEKNGLVFTVGPTQEVEPWKS